MERKAHDTFLTHAIEIARLDYDQAQADGMSIDPRESAKSALREAHSSLSQPQFFLMIDRLGGHEKVVQQITGAISKQAQLSHREERE